MARPHSPAPFLANFKIHISLMVDTVPGQHVLPWSSWEEAVPQWTEGSSQIAAGSHCVFKILWVLCVCMCFKLFIYLAALSLS